MSDLKPGSSEARFADLIWEKEPIASGELAKLALAQFQWKKTTAFTVLKRLCERGLFQNQGGTVRALISREEYYAHHSRRYVEDTFQGSLPSFLVAFASSQKLSDAEVEELKQIIDTMRG